MEGMLRNDEPDFIDELNPSVKVILAAHAIVTLAQAHDFLDAIANSPDACRALEIGPDEIRDARDQLPKQIERQSTLQPMSFVPGVPVHREGISGDEEAVPMLDMRDQPAKGRSE
jgi:hypothetical protein